LLDLVTWLSDLQPGELSRGLAKCGACFAPRACRILEFSETCPTPASPRSPLYSRCILPLIGGALSGSREAYKYLRKSVRKFPR